MRKLKAELILLLIATIWAGTFVVIKLTIEDTPPFLFVALRFAIATILFIIIFYKRIRIRSKEELIGGLALGILLYAGFTTQTIGLIYTTASNSALITGINILLIPFIQIPLLKKGVPFEVWLSITIAFIGLGMLTRPFENGINFGDAITLACAISWAFYIVLLDIWSKKHDLYAIVFIQFVVVTLLALIPGLIFESFSDIETNTEFISALIYTGVFATLIATFLGNKYQKETTPVRAGLVFLWEQPAAVILSILLLGEILDAVQIAGGFLMVGGILYSETYEYIRLKRAEKNFINNG